MEGRDSTILIYGAPWCPDAARSRQFLDENQIPYSWFDIDEDPEAKAFVRQTNQGKVVLPTIVFPDGSVLVEPSNADLAAKLESLGRTIIGR